MGEGDVARGGRVLFHSKGMKVASSVSVVEADPAPDPSLGPRDDMQGVAGR